MKLLPIALALLGLPALLTAGDPSAFQLITLKDKSVIRAQVTEVTGGYYVAASPTLGSLKIPTSQVVSITPEDPATNSVPPSGTMLPATPVNVPQGPTGKSSADAASAALLSPALTSKVQSFFSTGGGMSALQQFSQNKALKSVMNDPEVMKAIQNGDYDALMKSPAMSKLIDNPETKQLIQSILKPDAAKPAKASPTPATKS
ncbi:MAG: hypothetical protein ACOYM3_20205 [Terrimicrobiaceae bacterium]